MLDHVIPLHTEERITIVHGENGVGKTIILRLLNDLFSHKNTELRKVPFNKFQVDLDDDSSFWVTKSQEKQPDENVQPPSDSILHFHWDNPGYKSETFDLEPKRWQKGTEEL